MSIRIFQVDAFSDRPFKGNPAGVCLMDRARDAAWMRSFAAEMNLAETAFLTEGKPADATAKAGWGTGFEAFGLRWFTPAIEIELCGHATLASAHVLWETGILAPDQRALFDTMSGRLSAVRKGDFIEMDFPALHPVNEDPPSELSEALGMHPLHVVRYGPKFLALMESEDAVRACTPDLALLKTLPVEGLVITSKSSRSDCDFVSRFFAPAAGVDEDPVTGSAHCALAPFWAERLHKSEMTGYQASERGGYVQVRLAGSRVKLLGKAVMIFSGELGSAL